MPAHLLAFFESRPPLEVLPGPKQLKHKPYDGLADFISGFETDPPPPKEPFESPAEKKARIKKEKASQRESLIAKKAAAYDPTQDEDKVKTADPRLTLFVGRLSYDTTEKKLLRAFEQFGPVSDLRIVTDRHKKPRGYAFIEFRSNYALRAAYREANGMMLDGRRILVDLERARTTPNWLPRRLGGGEGPPRIGVPKALQRRMTERRTPGPRREPAPTRGRGGGPSSRWRGGGSDERRDDRWRGGGDRDRGEPRDRGERDRERGGYSTRRY